MQKIKPLIHNFLKTNIIHLYLQAHNNTSSHRGASSVSQDKSKESSKECSTEDAEESPNEYTEEITILIKGASQPDSNAGKV